MTVPTDLNPALSLGALVAEQAARARLFEQLRLDYCCGSRQSLAEACAKRGLDLDDVQAALQELDSAESSHKIESTDWRTVGLGQLCEHIVAVHHNGLRDAFPRIGKQLRQWFAFTGPATRGCIMFSASSTRSAPTSSLTWPARKASCFRRASPGSSTARPSTSA